MNFQMEADMIQMKQQVLKQRHQKDSTVHIPEVRWFIHLWPLPSVDVEKLDSRINTMELWHKRYSIVTLHIMQTGVS